MSRPQETPPDVQDVLDGLVTQPTETEQADHPENPITTRLLPSMSPTNDGIENGVLRSPSRDRSSGPLPPRPRRSCR